MLEDTGGTICRNQNRLLGLLKERNPIFLMLVSVQQNYSHGVHEAELETGNRYSSTRDVARLRDWQNLAIFFKSRAILKLQSGILEVYYTQMQGPNA